MPWQRDVVDVALEIDPDTGQLAYSEVGLTVPRQSGKSTLILAKATHRSSARGFFGSRQRVTYTAQTRQKAREKWEEDFVPDLEHAPMYRAKITVHKGNGNEHIRFQNGSRFGIEASTEKAGHGNTIDEAYIDEAFAQVDGRLEQAFRPAMITRRNKQLWWVSTAGWKDASPYLEAKTKRGREAVNASLRSGLAYFEWSAPPDADPYDRGVWWRCMPALGHTISEDAIAHELEMADTLADFKRAYLNQWVLKNETSESMIPLSTWQRSADGGSSPGDPVAFAVDVARDRSWSAIAVAGRRADGRDHVEVLPRDYRPGTEWLIPRMVELTEKWHPCAWVLDPGSPAGALIKAADEAGIRTKCACHGEQGVQLVSAREKAQAAGALYDACINDRFRHRDQPHLNLAVSKAATRQADDAWVWSRKDSSVDISPLWAVTLAKFGFDAHGTAEVEDVNLWGVFG